MLDELASFSLRFSDLLPSKQPNKFEEPQIRMVLLGFITALHHTSIEVFCSSLLSKHA